MGHMHVYIVRLWKGHGDPRDFRAMVRSVEEEACALVHSPQALAEFFAMQVSPAPADDVRGEARFPRSSARSDGPPGVSLVPHQDGAAR